MQWAKMIAKFDPYGAMINRGNRILIVQGAQSSTILMASAANQMLIFVVFSIRNIIQVFLFHFISIHYI